MLGDKQIPSVGIFDEVSFYTLFRVHLPPISGIYAPKRYLIAPFQVFYSRMANMRNKMLLDTFWDKWKQWSSVEEESSNRTSQDNLSRYLAGIKVMTASQFTT